MKSIKEKAEEYGENWYNKNGFFSNNKCRGCYAHVFSSYEAGANYVLDEIEPIIKADLGSYKFQLDKIKQTIEQLK